MEENFLRALQDRTAGDPMRQEVRWTDLNYEQIAEHLTEAGTPVSVPVVKQLLGNHDVADLAALRALAMQPRVSQRELSASLGMSLGKTNYVLRALLEKGLVKADNFRRSDKKLGYAYLLTPAGVEAKARLTREFLRRKLTEFDDLERTIADLRAELGDRKN